MWLKISLLVITNFVVKVKAVCPGGCDTDNVDYTKLQYCEKLTRSCEYCGTVCDDDVEDLNTLLDCRTLCPLYIYNLRLKRQRTSTKPIGTTRTDTPQSNTFPTYYILIIVLVSMAGTAVFIGLFLWCHLYRKKRRKKKTRIVVRESVQMLPTHNLAESMISDEIYQVVDDQHTLCDASNVASPETIKPAEDPYEVTAPYADPPPPEFPSLCDEESLPKISKKENPNHSTTGQSNAGFGRVSPVGNSQTSLLNSRKVASGSRVSGGLPSRAQSRAVTSQMPVMSQTSGRAEHAFIDSFGPSTIEHPEEDVQRISHESFGEALFNESLYQSYRGSILAVKGVEQAQLDQGVVRVIVNPHYFLSASGILRTSRLAAYRHVVLPRSRSTERVHNDNDVPLSMEVTSGTTTERAVASVIPV